MGKQAKNFGKMVARYPIFSFIIALFVLFALIFASNKIRSQHDVAVFDGANTKVVEVMRVEDGQYTELSGQVEKDGVITITSRVSGIVYDVYVEDGQDINTGQRVAYFSDTYGGGNSAAIGYQIAARQTQNSDEIIDKTMSILDDQRDDVSKTGSIEEEVERKQYTIQKRNTEANHEITQLTERQAAVNAAMYAPTSPFTGVVDHVFVSKGETVSFGDKIAAINADDQTVDISVNLSPELASIVNVSQPSIVNANGQSIEVMPKNLSRGVANDQTYILTFAVDQQYIDLFEHNEFVSIKVPVESHSGDKEGVLVPLDAVRLMSDKTVLFVMNGDVAEPREVQSGEIVGGFIFVNGDISSGDNIILDRNVFDGDPVTIES